MQQGDLDLILEETDRSIRKIESTFREIVIAKNITNLLVCSISQALEIETQINQLMDFLLDLQDEAVEFGLETLTVQNLSTKALNILLFVENEIHQDVAAE